MSIEKIDQTDFLNLHGVSFSFFMTKFLNPELSKDESLTAICKVISTAYQKGSPIWARLVANHRIVQITLENELYLYLDPESRDKVTNWLIFKRKGNSIAVTHFGPFQSMEGDVFQDMVDETDSTLAILRNLLNELDFLDDEMSEDENELTPNDIQDELMAKFWGSAEDFELKIESKKTELKVLTNGVYDKPEDRAAAQELIGKIKASTGKVLIKAVTAVLCAEMFEKIVGKIAAKVAAKTASKGAGKAAGKALPFVGAVVCAGFGIWRLSYGDYAGAGLEFASGAASCVPGTGTATSLAIDAALVSKDVIEARNEGNKYLEVNEACLILKKKTVLFKNHTLTLYGLFGRCTRDLASNSKVSNAPWETIPVPKTVP